MTTRVSDKNIPIISGNLGELTDKDAWNQNLRLADMAAAKISSCLGPKGAYKLVTYHRGPELVAKVTKDAVDIVDELGVQYPAIKTIAEGAKLHRQEAGDGVSSMLLIVSELLRGAEQLINKKVHPNTILRGYGVASRESMRMVDELSELRGGPLDPNLIKTVDCGRNLIGSALGAYLSEAIGQMSKEGQPDLAMVKIVQKSGGSTRDSEFIRGAIVRKGRADSGMPESVNEPHVAILNAQVVIKPLEVKMPSEGRPLTKVEIGGDKTVQMFLAEEMRMRVSIVEKLTALGVNVLFCRAKIDSKISSKLAREGIFAAELVDQAELDQIAHATGASSAADVNTLEAKDLGSAKKLEVSKLGPDEITILRCARGASFILRGSSPELVQELEKSVKNALLIQKHSLTNPKVVPGGGALFMHLATRLRGVALDYPGRQQLAIDAFADALEEVPRCLARNSGLDPIDAVAELRKNHSEGRSHVGITLDGRVDVCPEELVELASVNKATIRRALEITNLLLRVDQFFFTKDLPLFHKQ